MFFVASAIASLGDNPSSFASARFAKRIVVGASK